MNLLRSLAAVLLAVTLSEPSARGDSPPPTVVEAVFVSIATVPITTASYVAAGNTVNLSLNFAPPTGTRLMVVNNTGTEFIDGTFINLAQGQMITLPFGNRRYQFAANYFGGTGNDLVLEWGTQMAYSWGFNGSGQLGNGGTSNGLVPAAIKPGVLAGKVIVAQAIGSNHSLALCADGTLAAWGGNTAGQLGDHTNTSSTVPVAVDTTGALAGKTVLRIAAGSYHNLALCTDGTVVAWGVGTYGQLGNGGRAHSNVPVPVTTTTGILAGKTIIAIAAGPNHSLALCADGTLAAWGGNASGELGNGDYSDSSVPVAVTSSGVPADRTPVAIGAGSSHNLALCSNGTMVAWGYGGYGQLGNGSTETSRVPVNVTTTGVLAGKTVAAIAVGGDHNLALCTNGAVVAWGKNDSSQLGRSGADSSVPLSVSVWSGKSVATIGAGNAHSFVFYTEGTLSGWGNNFDGQLGNGSTSDRTSPTWLTTSTLPDGARIGQLAVGSQAHHTMALVALPLSNNSSLAALGVSPGVFEQAFSASMKAYTVRVLHGTTEVRLTPTVANAFATVTVNGIPVVSGTASPAIPWSPGNPASRVQVTAPDGSSTTYQITFREDATLAGLSLSLGSLIPAFSPSVTQYTAQVANATAAIAITPTGTDPSATIAVNGQAVVSGNASEPVSLALETTQIPITVTATDGTAMTYTVTVLRPGPLEFTYPSASAVPVTSAGYIATGLSVNLALGFTPAGPVNLTVVNNTGPDAIIDQFTNLYQGQLVNLTRNGITYPFVADYFGGTGNDLVLRWGNNQAYGWGPNTAGQLGTGTTALSNVPVPVSSSGFLSGLSIIALAKGGSHSLALGADGTLAAWGSNAYGQLGIGNTVNRTVPAAVVMTGALAGKRVTAIAAGNYHNLALCADGTVVGWGRSDYGQIGAHDSAVPIVIPATGALTGKKVIAIAAGAWHSLALCADGSIVGWGSNAYGNLGDGRTDPVVVDPVATTLSGVLAGKTMIAIAAGFGHSLALAADGTVAAWGYNNSGELGDGTTTNSSVPVAVTTTGLLAGKTVVAISAGYSHSLALCSDGSLAAWGLNSLGALGNNSTTSSSVPVAVVTTGILGLGGKKITAISAGNSFSNALCSDGTLAAWGIANALGNGASSPSSVPVAVFITGSGSGEKFSLLSTGSGASHSLALTASPLSSNSALAGLALDPGTLSPAFTPGVTTFFSRIPHGTTAIRVTPTLADVRSTVTANGTVIASGAASEPIPLSPGDPALTLKVTAQNGTATTYKVVVRDDSTLSGLALSDGVLSPAFATETTAYIAYVTHPTATLTVAPTANDPAALLTVNGAKATSGAASDPLALAPGTNLITVKGTALDGSVTTYTVTVIRQVPLAAAFTSAAMVPATAAGYTTTANTVELSLSYAPVTGTTLTVINNTGRDFIKDRFTNLAQGQVVTLVFNQAKYRFVANYYGGTGNDLVLQWANVKAYGWGSNTSSQIGNGGTNTISPLAPVVATGVLAAKTILAVAAGAAHSVALCADGTVAAWGSNTYGQLGNGTTTNSSVPVTVTRTGALAGRTVIAIAVGANSNLALCTDGTLVAWGINDFGQLGTGTTTNSAVPVVVTNTGILAGKTVMAIAAGGSHSLALCTDGRLAAWGSNGFGQLGNGTTTNSAVPVAVTTASGLLAGKMISAIAAGGSHNLALCSDGTLAAWGANSSGQLGNESISNSSLPVAVISTGLLSGKSVTGIAAGNSHSLCRCADGTLAAWGPNGSYQLGTGNSSSSSAPAPVVRTGVLAGKTATALAAGSLHSVVCCSDGSLATWGNNGSRQLGDGTTISMSSVPVTVITSALGAGETFMAATTGVASNHNIGLAALPVSSDSRLASLTLGSASLTAPFAAATLTHTARVARTITAVTVTPTAADANSLISVNGTLVTSGTASLEIPRVPGIPTPITIQVTAQNGTSTSYIVTLMDDATLAGLSLSTGSLSPAFAADTTDYLSYVASATDSLTLTPTVTDPTSTIAINGISIASGSASNALNLVPGTNSITVEVTALDGSTTRYHLLIVRQVPLNYTFASATGVAATAAAYTAAGNTVNLALNFAPAAGTNLTVVNQTGTVAIQGAFDNLAQGQLVQLAYGGVTYPFVANYFGGTGNDLVLQWTNTRLLAWGANANGEFGNNSTTSSSLAVPVDHNGVLAGRTVIRVAEGNFFTLALCGDGTLAAWGRNDHGQLGDNTTLIRKTPVAVVQTGVLAGKTVVAIAAGEYHSLALCSDGTLAAWGQDNSGQLGNGSTPLNSSQPVRVDQTGVLAGKAVIAIAAHGSHNLALCADGTLAAWGYNNFGQLGDGTTTTRPLPVLVDLTGVLAGKTVTAIATGSSHSLALCADGTLAAWGSNLSGKLGDNSSMNQSLPVLVVKTGALAGKTVTAIATGDAHNLALCSDGTVVTWGYNAYGQLGINSIWDRGEPLAITTNGALAGKRVQSLAAGSNHSLAVCNDGTLISWGLNANGQLGNGNTTNSLLPVAVTRNGMGSAERFVAAAGGWAQTFAVIATPPAPLATTMAATAIDQSVATLNGTVNAQGSSTTVSFEYGQTTAYGSTAAAVPATVNGTVATAVASPLSGLIAGAIYHYRVVATNPNGTIRSEDMTFTPSRPPTFAGHTVSTPWQTATTIPLRKILAKASDPDGDLVTVTGVGTVSAQGGTVVLQGLGVLYTPRAGFSGEDSFPVTLTDAGGASAIGTVTVTVGLPSTAGGVGVNPPTLTSLPDGKMGIAFHGIPGRSYIIQRSANGLDNWVTLATVIADANGKVSFTDEAPPPGSAFYRLGLP